MTSAPAASAAARSARPRQRTPTRPARSASPTTSRSGCRSEEHTSELQSPCNLVCRLLLEKKKKTKRAASHAIRRHHHHPAHYRTQPKRSTIHVLSKLHQQSLKS